MADDPVTGMSMNARWTEIRLLCEEGLATGSWECIADAIVLLKQVKTNAHS